MSRRRTLAPLVFVEGVGLDRSPFSAIGISRSADRICILPTPGGDQTSLTNDILRAIGKRGRKQKLRLSVSSDALTLRTWLIAEGVGDMFVGRANHLSGDQLDLLEEASHFCRVWLLFDGRTPTHVHKRWATLETSSVRKQSVAASQLRSRDEERIDWSNFPALPLHREVFFRGRCKRLFDDGDMLRIDSAIAIGADHAKDVLSKGGSTAEEVAAPGLDSTVPTWPALAMLRGCQLGALSSGYVLAFNVRMWLRSRQTTGDFDQVATEALKESIDPLPAALAILYVLTAAPVSSLIELGISDLSEDASVIRVQDSVFHVPASLAGPLRAQRMRSVETDSETLLFASYGGSLSHRRAHKILVAELRRLGLPSAIDTQTDVAKQTGSARTLSPMISLDLRPMSHVALR